MALIGFLPLLQGGQQLLIVLVRTLFVFVVVAQITVTQWQEVLSTLPQRLDMVSRQLLCQEHGGAWDMRFHLVEPAVPRFLQG